MPQNTSNTPYSAAPAGQTGHTDQEPEYTYYTNTPYTHASPAPPPPPPPPPTGHNYNHYTHARAARVHAYLAAHAAPPRVLHNEAAVRRRANKPNMERFLSDGEAGCLFECVAQRRNPPPPLLHPHQYQYHHDQTPVSIVPRTMPAALLRESGQVTVTTEAAARR